MLNLHPSERLGHLAVLIKQIYTLYIKIYRDNNKEELMNLGGSWGRTQEDYEEGQDRDRNNVNMVFIYKLLKK